MALMGLLIGWGYTFTSVDPCDMRVGANASWHEWVNVTAHNVHRRTIVIQKKAESVVRTAANTGWVAAWLATDGAWVLAAPLVLSSALRWSRTAVGLTRAIGR